MTAPLLFDSHLHLTDDRFAEDRAQVVRRARQAGVRGMVTVASHLDDAREAAGLAAAEPDLRCTAGLHPHHADTWPPRARRELERLLEGDEVVAVGETGLDFHYMNAPREIQMRAFREQMEMAAERKLPVVVHARAADRETAGVIDAFAGRVTGVLHCFSGGESLLEAGLEAGWYVSFSGLVTFGSWSSDSLVRRVPSERLLLETDSPYLSPAPLRGRRNEPAHLVHVARKVAEIRGEDVETLAAETYGNARRFYGLSREGAPEAGSGASGEEGP